MFALSSAMMNTLFPVETAFPQGFLYTPNFINVEEEEYLYKEIQQIHLHEFTFQGFKANRKVASFGYDYSFDNGKLTKSSDIPKPFNFLVDKVAAFLSINTTDFAELLITEYPPGSVINWHRDAPPFDIIAGISLMADCNFKLRPYDKAKQTRASIVTIPVKRRSLYIIKDVVRTDYQHSIAPVKQTRYSITTRTLRSK